MPRVRTIQALIFLIAMAMGMVGLMVWQPKGHLKWAENFLSPVKNESFRVGAKIEDKLPPDSRERVIREVTPPAHTALDFVICEIDDDPEQINAFGLYHPADLAITLNNLRDQGVKQIFISTHLHWPNKEPAENNTLATAMQGFDSVVVTTPLRRQLAGTPITPAFLRSSLPLSGIDGDSELLPRVNSFSLEPNLRFPQNTYAGFSTLESENATSTVPLLARWDDRLVFSSLLLALMQQYKATPEDVQVVLGSYIRLGNTGNIIPINSFGHYQPDLSFTAKPAPRTITSALSGQSSIIGATQKSAILTANGQRSSQFEAIDSPYFKLSQLAFTPRVSAPMTLKRIPLWLECILIADVAFLCAWFLAYRSMRRNTAFLISLIGIGLTFLSVYHIFHYWSPVSVYLLTLLSGWTLTTILAKPARRSLLSEEH
ncbi:hypothetical protein [Rubritalea tangerina]|uniref:CHASE2 domain-containing protein n=1 Tax=Rubritalea tangerina TaxID=430798 RepID=A0ABW4Z9B9_9BACT